MTESGEASDTTTTQYEDEPGYSSEFSSTSQESNSQHSSAQDSADHAAGSWRSDSENSGEDSWRQDSSWGSGDSAQQEAEAQAQQEAEAQAAAEQAQQEAEAQAQQEQAQQEAEAQAQQEAEAQAQQEQAQQEAEAQAQQGAEAQATLLNGGPSQEINGGAQLLTHGTAELSSGGHTEISLPTDEQLLAPGTVELSTSTPKALSANTLQSTGMRGESVLGQALRYGDSNKGYRYLGHNVQLDHLIPQEITRVERTDFDGKLEYRPKNDLTIAVETGNVDGHRLPHTEKGRFDRREIDDLKAIAPGEGRSTSDYIGRLQDATAAAGYPDRSEVDKAWLQQLSERHGYHDDPRKKGSNSAEVGKKIERGTPEFQANVLHGHPGNNDNRSVDDETRWSDFDVPSDVHDETASSTTQPTPVAPPLD